MSPLESIFKVYNDVPNSGKIMIFLLIILIIVLFFKFAEQYKIKLMNVGGNNKEGYEQNDSFLFKKDGEVYDNFYANVYDYLVYNNTKDDYEVGAIVNSTVPTSKSIILDIGCGTGHHVAKFAERDLNIIGIDQSVDMIEQAQKNYPNYKFQVGNAMDSSLFIFQSFTHILCMYFTIYYMEDKQAFFNNCMQWLMPGGYLIIHLVDREHFDPILPTGNPLYIVSPQKYAKERIKKTKITFKEFKYESDFEMKPDGNDDIAIFHEKFVFPSGKIRNHEHTLYMETHADILSKATDMGFIIHGKIDLMKCAYENQYLYILVKPE